MRRARVLAAIVVAGFAVAGLAAQQRGGGGGRGGGIPPTGKYVEIPLVVIVQFRGDRIYNEHIYWDQASVLVQIGLLDPARYPVAGRETAQKVLDEYQPSNTLMGRWQESEGKAAS